MNRPQAWVQVMSGRVATTATAVSTQVPTLTCPSRRRSLAQEARWVGSCMPLLGTSGAAGARVSVLRQPPLLQPLGVPPKGSVGPSGTLLQLLVNWLSASTLAGVSFSAATGSTSPQPVSAS